MQGQYRQNQLYSYRTGRVRAYNIRYKYFPVRLASRIENTEECFSQQMCTLSVQKNRTLFRT
jgi:hypothetical protein